MGDTLPVLGTSPTSSCGNTRNSVSRSPTPERGNVPMSAVVWAKMKGFPAWPARIIDPKANDLNPKIRKEAQKSPPNSHFVKFYGTHDFSWVLSSDILWPFERHAHLELAAKKKGRKQLLKAIAEAKLCADDDGADGDVDKDDGHGSFLENGSLNNNDDENDRCYNNNNNNNVSAEKRQQQGQQRHHVDLEDSRPDFDDLSNDSDGLVIDTSRSSSISGEIKLESKDVKPRVDGPVGGVVVPRSSTSTTNSAHDDSSIYFDLDDPEKSDFADGGGGGGDGVVSYSSPARSAACHTTTLSFDIKSVISGHHSPPKCSSTPPTIVSTSMTSPPTPPLLTMKRKSPIKESTFSSSSSVENSSSAKKKRKKTSDSGDVGGGRGGMTPTEIPAATTPNRKASEEVDATKNPTTPAATKKEKKSKKRPTTAAPKAKLDVKMETDGAFVTENYSDGNLLSVAGVKNPPMSPKQEPEIRRPGSTPVSPKKETGGVEAAGKGNNAGCERKPTLDLQKERFTPLFSERANSESPPPVPTTNGNSKGKKQSSKSASPSKQRPPKPQSIVPLGRSYPNQKTSITYREHFQEWTIEDYANVTKLFSKPGTYIQGQKFMVRDDAWVLRLYPCGDTGEKGDPNFVGVFAELVSRPSQNQFNDVKAVLRISILSKDKRKVWGEEMAAYTAHTLSFSMVKEKKRNVMGYAQFISRDTLFKHKGLFLPNGHLTLGVTLTVLGEVTTKVMTQARPYTNATTTATDFAGLIDDPIFSDFAIHVEGKTIRVHKAILCARSTVFRDMFLQRPDINSFDSIQLDDISYRVLHDLLLFVYSGYSSILKDKPFDLTADSEAAAPAASAEAAQVEGAAAAAAAVAAVGDEDERLRLDLLRQLCIAAEKYQIAELRMKAEEELSRKAPLNK